MQKENQEQCLENEVEVYTLKDDEFILKYMVNGNQLDMNATIRVAKQCGIELRRVVVNAKNHRTAGAKLKIKKESRRNVMCVISLDEMEQIKDKALLLHKKHRIKNAVEGRITKERIMRVYENMKWCYENNFNKYESFYPYIHKK